VGRRAQMLFLTAGVVSAPLPLRIIEKCLASDRIVIDTVVSKYCNHTPLHRQSVILKRDISLEISRATWTAGSSRSASCWFLWSLR